MVKLKIDGIEIEVEQGTKVIEAAARLGIIIPRFCYHKGLGSVGACRMCAVKFLEGPVKGVQMSCMVDASDGMVVSTTDEEAVDFRRHVIEWLMMNHPHDCPVCDEGGHCLLQDMTVAGGHGIRRFLGKKRTYRDQYLGIFVQHEMNRCIHCWRCRRFYQDFAGYRDLGAMQIASHTYFGRFQDGPLESPFSGNLIDLCPTGVYTDKPSRFTGRRWDFQRAPSLCIHCSLGCHTIASARYRELVRLEARFSESVNGYFICDRGRYGFYYTHHPERPRHPRVGAEEVSWEKAIQRAAEKLSKITEKNGAQSVACLGSTRSCLENQAMLKRFCKLQGWGEPKYFADSSIERKVKKAVSRLDKTLVISMRDIERADFIIAVGADPVNEAPMLTLAMRQAYRQGATIVVIDPRPIFLPFEFHPLPVTPEEIDPCLNTLIKEAVDRSVAETLGEAAVNFYDHGAPTEQPSDGLFKDRLAALGQKLRQSKNPVIVCGTEMVSETTPGFAADNALLLQAAKSRAGLFYLMSGPNAFGAALLSPEAGSLMNVVDAIEGGTVRALLLVESDPFRTFPDQERLKQAVEKLDLLLVMDYLPSEAARLAQILLPTRTLFEMETSFINQEGRVQFAASAHRGGIPICQINAGSHPSRLFQSDIPGGEPEPAWVILAKLANTMPLPGRETLSLSRGELWNWITKEAPSFSNVQLTDERSDGIRIDLGQGKEKPFARRVPPEKARRGNGELELLLSDWTFGTEELSAYSKFIQQVEKEPCLSMNPKDASRAGMKDGESVTLHLNRGPLVMELRVASNVAPGIIVLPKHRQLPWQKMERWPEIIGLDRIKK
jgi:NADH-quinone oxidoreductase subunit G